MRILITAFLFIFSTISLSAQDFDKVTFEGEEYYLLPNDFEPHKAVIKDQYPNYINNFKLPDGKWIQFLPSMPQYPYVMGQYENGIAEGTWRFYSIDWDDTTSYIYLTSEYVNGKRNGRQLYYSESNVLSQRFDFKNDAYHGDFISYNAQGVILLEGQYMYGIPVGKWEFNKHNGDRYRTESYKEFIPEDSIEFYLGKNRYKRPETRVLDLNNPVTEMEYIPSAEGTWNEYFEDGTVRFEKTYTNGFMKYIREYYENGVVKEEGGTLGARDYDNYPVKRSYDPDMPGPYIKNGMWYYYDETGKLIKTELFKNGEPYRGEDFYILPNE